MNDGAKEDLRRIFTRMQEDARRMDVHIDDLERLARQMSVTRDEAGKALLRLDALLEKEGVADVG